MSDDKEAQEATAELRVEPRITARCAVELTWKSEDKEKVYGNCQSLNISENGVAVECPEALPLYSHVILRAEAFQVAALAEVRRCSWQRSIYVLGLRFLAKTATVQSDPCAADYYELLRLGSDAEPETVERVYRRLARRFHPDNLDTGDAEAFLRLTQAYRVLSDPVRRSNYDAERRANHRNPRFQYEPAESLTGVVAEQHRRLALLCLLYRRRATNFENPGLSIQEMEELTGYTHGELGFSMWYSCDKGYARFSDRDYCLTATGVDFVEEKLAQDRGGLLAIAAGRNPQRPSITRIVIAGEQRDVTDAPQHFSDAPR